MSPSAGRRDDDRAFGGLPAGASASCYSLHRGGIRPAPVCDAKVSDVRVRYQTIVDVDHFMRAVGTQARDTVVADSELHARAPAKPGRAASCCYQGRNRAVRRLCHGDGVVVAGHRLHNDLAVDTCQPSQVLPDDGALERTLRGQCRVLPVASATAARVGIRTRRPDPVRRWRDDVNRVRASEPCRDLRNPCNHALARQRVPDENHGLPGGSSHAPAALRDIADFHLHGLTNLKTHRTLLFILGSHFPT